MPIRMPIAPALALPFMAKNASLEKKGGLQHVYGVCAWVCGMRYRYERHPLHTSRAHLLTYLLTSRTLINVVVQDSEDYRMKERVSE